LLLTRLRTKQKKSNSATSNNSRKKSTRGKRPVSKMKLPLSRERAAMNSISLLTSTRKKWTKRRENSEKSPSKTLIGTKIYLRLRLSKMLSSK
jgi:hypothetical protein